MQEGTYRLTRDIPALKPDARKHRDWRAAPVKAGTLFAIENLYYNEDKTCLMVFLSGGYSFENIALKNFPADALELVQETPSQWIHRLHGPNSRSAENILDVLVERGLVTLEQIIEAAKE